MSRWIVLALCLLAATAGKGQLYSLDHWHTSNSPLGNNSVRAMEMNQEGHIWLGTDWGLYRFDGESDWIEFTLDNSSIPSNQIRSIAFDAQNELWIGTFNHGLAHFDGTQWEVFNTQNSGLPDNFVKFLKFDQNNSLWISTTGGLVKKSGDDWTVWNAYNSDLWTNNLTTILVDETTNDKYVGSVNGGLSIFKNDTLHAVEMSYTHGIPDNTLYGMAFTESGQLWVAAPSGGLMIRFSSMLWQWYNAENSSLPSSSYNDIVIGNSTYLASQDAGLVIFDGESYSAINTFNSNLSTNDLAGLKLSSDGTVLWMATLSNGLYRANLPTLSLASRAKSKAIVYPNPFDEILMYDGVEGEVTIFTAEGKEWIKLDVTTGAAIDTSNWPKGIYFLSDNGEYFKLIKQ
jgi:ligand-binding sensor domain-containing protein